MDFEILSIIILFISFFALLAIGVPVVYSIGISTTITLLMNVNNMPAITGITCHIRIHAERNGRAAGIYFMFTLHLLFV